MLYGCLVAHSLGTSSIGFPPLTGEPPFRETPILALLTYNILSNTGARGRFPRVGLRFRLC